MNIRDLQYVIAVAETRHFGRAAQRCFVSQPTLSGQIKKLEEELGVTLFERGNRSPELTRVGEEILAHAKLVLGEVEAIKQLSLAAQDPFAGTLRLGAIPTLCPYVIPLIAAPIAQQFPKIDLSFAEGLTDNIVEKLRNHELDACLIATQLGETGITSISLCHEPFYLATPKGHPLNGKAELQYQDLQSLDILLLEDGHCLTDQVMELCGINVNATVPGSMNFRATSLETLLQLVSSGQGSTLVPVLARNHSSLDSGKIHLRKLKLPKASRCISLVMRESFPRGALLRALADLIQTAISPAVTQQDEA